MSIISVAMATYNGEKYLREQIDSILCQTLKPDEIVICDDCSSDTTQNIVSEYQSRFPQLFRIVFNEKNLGYIKNFEKALKLCSGDLIALSDQDDVWLPNKLEILSKNIAQNLLIHSDAYLIDKNGDITHTSYNKTANKDITFNTLLFCNSVTGCTCMMNKKILTYFDTFPDTIPHDYWLALIAAYHNALTYFPMPLIQYRQHETNVLASGGKSKNKHSIKNKLGAVWHLIKDRNSTLNYIYMINQTFFSLHGIDEHDVTSQEFFYFLSIYHDKKQKISFEAQKKYFRYYRYLKGFGHQYFFIPVLKLLSAFYIY
jgi:glycosyltransferase involved in cell wall biosynthesis